MAAGYLSIGEVLVNLKPDFPDVTISKIRFLESEGLINPDRTESGYRKFSESDIDRLRRILQMQRDEYLPLKVIKQRIESAGNGPRRAPAAAAHAPADDPGDDLARPATDVQMTAQELAQASGVEVARIEELESFGLLRGKAVGEGTFYEGENLVLLRILRDFFKYGVEPRHLTMYKHFADREAGFFEAIVLPVMRQRNPEARKQASEALSELAGASRRLKQTLLRMNLRPHIDGS